MSHDIVQPAEWPPPKGYANGVLCEAGSRLLVVSGQVAWDESGRLVSRKLDEQFAQALRNVVRVVEEAGGRAQDVVRLTFFVLDRREYEQATRAIGQAYRELFGKHYPACTLVEVRGLLARGALVEIEATAAIPENRS